jgi:RNA polymerase sigma-70 factor (ECF subfamily)
VTQWFSRWFKSAATSQDIMLRFADTGKPELLDQLVRLNGDDLYHFVLSQSDTTLAADICQSTWIKVIEKRSHYQSKGSFKSWLFTLGRNLLIDEMRRQQRWQTIALQDNELISLELTEQLSKVDDLTRFNNMLTQLPFMQREAFMLQQEGFSLNEIANITGDNNQTIKSRLRYVKNTAKKLFIQVQEEER